LQPSGLKTRTVDDGFASSFDAGRRGRGSNSPPQFGHLPFRRRSAQVAQNVHSNEQIRASGDSGGRSTSQHSQEGRSSSIRVPVVAAMALEIVPDREPTVFVDFFARQEL
jgi:hypothetical protein